MAELIKDPIRGSTYDSLFLDENFDRVGEVSTYETMKGEKIYKGRVEVKEGSTIGGVQGWKIKKNIISSDADNDSAGIFIDAENEIIRVGKTSGNNISVDGANLRIRSSNYVAGVSGFTVEPGLVEAENLIARGTMRGATFKYDVISSVGGQLMVADSDVLDSDMTALDAATMTVRGDTTFAVNDILVMRGVTASGIQEEWFRVTNIGSAPTYTVTRDLAASFGADSNPVWQAGTPVVKQGTSDGAAAYSGGWLRLFGEGTNSPYYSVYARDGLAYDDYSEQIRMGNLNGIGGVTSDSYGIFAGNATDFFIFDGVVMDYSGQFNDRKFVFVGANFDGFQEVVSGATITRSTLTTLLDTNASSTTKAKIYSGTAHMGWLTTSDFIQWDSGDFDFSGLVSFSHTSSQDAFIGLMNLADINGADPGDNATEVGRHIGFYIQDGTLYASNADGTTQTTTDISAGLTLTNFNRYRFILDAGTDIKFYVNGVLKATHTTNLPAEDDSSNVPIISFYIKTQADSKRRMFLRNDYRLSLQV